MKYFQFKHFPKSWDLDESWLEKISVTEKDKQFYLALNPIERQWLEASRNLLGSYRESGVLQPRKTVQSSIRKLTQELDKSLLAPGKGRATRYKGGLRVLEAYDQYHEWAKKHNSSNSVTLVDIVLPYWIDKSPYLKTPGFIRIYLWGEYPTFSRLGQTWLAAIHFSIEEQRFSKNWEIDEKIDPFLYFGAPRRHLPESQKDNVLYFRSEDVDEIYEGLTSCIRNYLHLFIFGHNAEMQINMNMKRFRASDVKKRDPLFGKDQYAGQCTTCPNRYALRFENSEPEQIQEILDEISRLYYESRFPRSDWKLQFKVEKENNPAIHVTLDGQTEAFMDEWTLPRTIPTSP